MELTLNFEKRFISRSVGKMLQENLPPNEVETLNRIVAGKKAQYKEANSLLYCILRAIENRGEEEELEFTIMGNNDQEQECSQEFSQQEDTEENERAGAGNPSKLDERAEGMDKLEGTDRVRASLVTCKFYANGKCKFSSECRYRHPKICQKFRLHGDTKLDVKGCDGRCGEFHPNVCRSSLKNRTCTYKECRFFHIKGTKTISRDGGSDPRGQKPYQQGGARKTNQSGQWKSAKLQQHETNRSRGTFESENRFGVLGQDQQDSQQVFHREKDKLDSTLQQIMKELADIRNWQKVRTEQTQAHSQQMNRSQAQLVPQAMQLPVVPQLAGQSNPWTTQDQHMAWRSQSY